MEINSDFSKRAVAHADALEWSPSPAAGVDRRMLDRVGGEVARATTIVRFAPEAVFEAHTHGGGEEFLVLDGVFSDEFGDFPAGSYVRNPPSSRHTPGSKGGVTILVKLHQFDPEDRTHLRTDMNKLAPVASAERPGVAVAPLFNDGYEDVRVERWAPGATVRLKAPGGFEAFVLEGGFDEGGEPFRRHSWLRLPSGARLEAIAGPEGARVWVKTGHLADPARLRPRA